MIGRATVPREGDGAKRATVPGVDLLTVPGVDLLTVPREGDGTGC